MNHQDTLEELFPAVFEPSSIDGRYLDPSEHGTLKLPSEKFAQCGDSSRYLRIEPLNDGTTQMIGYPQEGPTLFYEDTAFDTSLFDVLFNNAMIASNGTLLPFSSRTSVQEPVSVNRLEGGMDFENFFGHPVTQHLTRLENDPLSGDFPIDACGQHKSPDRTSAQPTHHSTILCTDSYDYRHRTSFRVPRVVQLSDPWPPNPAAGVLRDESEINSSSAGVRTLTSFRKSEGRSLSTGKKRYFCLTVRINSIEPRLLKEVEFGNNRFGRRGNLRCDACRNRKSKVDPKVHPS